MEFLHLYRYVFVLILVAAPLMALTGVHLPARSQTVKALMISQVAAFGLLLGIFLGDYFFLPSFLREGLFPIGLGLTLSLLISSWSKRYDCSSGESFYLVIYLTALAATYLICSVLPGLELYQSQVFFGDVVTISGTTLGLSIICFVVLLVYFLKNQRVFLKNSMEFELLAGQGAFRPKKDGYHLLSLAVIVIGLYSLGMLFTLSTMLIAPVLLHYRSSHLKSYLFLLVTVTTLTAIGGMGLSLVLTKWSTVPLMVSLNALVCFILLIFVKKKS